MTDIIEEYPLVSERRTLFRVLYGIFCPVICPIFTCAGAFLGIFEGIMKGGNSFNSTNDDRNCYNFCEFIFVLLGNFIMSIFYAIILLLTRLIITPGRLLQFIFIKNYQHNIFETTDDCISVV